MNKVKGDQYKGVLQVGQKVYSILYGGRNGVICKITGEQAPETIQTLGRGCIVMGGRATVDVVFEEYVSRGISEAIVRGVQWEILDEIVEPHEILSLLRNVAMVQGEKKEQEKKEAEEKNNLRAALPGKYPYLIPVAGSGKSAHAMGAKNLKTELTRIFSGIKFSTRSDSYAGGDSIYVSWTDGPTDDEVKKISHKYQEGSFDGMVDLYTSNHAAWPEVFGGAKYVSESRHFSAAVVLSVALNMGFKLTMDQVDKYGIIADSAGLDWEQQRMIYRETRKISCVAKAD